MRYRDTKECRSRADCYGTARQRIGSVCLTIDRTARPQCPVVANNGLPSHTAGTSAYPPIGDIRRPMSVIVLISSALPPAPDVGGTPGECLKLTSPV